MWRQAGSDLKVLAEQFAHSRERELVRRRAEQVDVATLDMHKFMELLKELFQVRIIPCSMVRLKTFWWY